VKLLRTLEKEDVENLLFAAKILGAGGGGQIEWSRPLIKQVYAKKKQFRLLDPNEIPNQEIVMLVGAVGGGVSEEMKRRLVGFQRIRDNPEFLATRVLAEYVGKEPYAYLASEIGAGNTIVPMYIAAMLDGVAIDADCCGRAKPEIAISTTNVNGIPITPLSIVSPFGDTIILKEAVDDFRAEEICRTIAVLSGGQCGVARCPAKGKDIRNAVVPNSISEAIKIGRYAREAVNPVEALIEISGGFRFFEGKVSSFERSEEGAFMRGTIEVEGTENFEGHKLKIWYKNEFLISWKDEVPFVSCPDTICVVDSISAEGLSCWNDDFRKGRNVVVFGRKAHSLWRTKRGLEIFSPKHFGFGIEYEPIENIVV
jgi:DUF917 family protein